MRYLDFAKGCHIQWKDSGAPPSPWQPHDANIINCVLQPPHDSTNVTDVYPCLFQQNDLYNPWDGVKGGSWRWNFCINLEQNVSRWNPSISWGELEEVTFLACFLQSTISLRASNEPRSKVWYVVVAIDMASQIIANLQPKVFPPTKAFHNSRTCCESCWSIRTSK